MYDSSKMTLEYIKDNTLNEINTWLHSSEFYTNLNERTIALTFKESE